MSKKNVFRASFLTFTVFSLALLSLAISDFYSCYADIKSVKFLTVEVSNVRLDNPSNETHFSFDIQIGNLAEGKIRVVRQESDLVVEGEHIRHSRIDYSPNELIIRPFDSTTRQVSMEIPSFKLHLFEKEEVHCRIETSVYIRTPFGQTRISNVHTKTLAVAV